MFGCSTKCRPHARTHHSIGELRALGEVSQAVNSTVDLETVLTTIVAKATQLSNTDAWRHLCVRRVGPRIQLRATYGMERYTSAAIRDRHIRLARPQSAGLLEQRRRPQISGTFRRTRPQFSMSSYARASRAHLSFHCLPPDRIVGALVVRRREPANFRTRSISCRPSAPNRPAIQNARLFREIEEKSRELEVASQHKSQFLAT